MPMTPEETAVVRALCKEPEMDIDALVRKLGLPAARFLIVAMQLEMKRIVRRLPGRRLALVEEVRRWAADLSDNN
jgi:predicted Rossmann fold nucleotide-binding protein DprA/Smf involved in DNA uptake